MYSDTTSNPLRYTVYVPYNSRANVYPLLVPENADVDHLGNLVREDVDVKHYVKQEPLHLFKCEDLTYDGGLEEVHREALKRLRGQPGMTKMIFAAPLSDYFPKEGRMEGRKIDVIAVPESFFESLERPITPENESSQVSDHVDATPRKEVKETEALVDNVLGRYDEKLKKFLSGPSWNALWEAPASADPEAARFINDLRIPRVRGKPMLLLHNLGNGIVDKSIVDEVFDGRHRLLVNTSGSGKTRLLLEGLIKYWGFYFTAVVEDVTSPIGSRDLHDTIFRMIPRSKRFKRKPQLLGESECDGAFLKNHDIAERRMFQIIKARMLVFKYFCQTIREIESSKDVNEFKTHWLSLQLFPSVLLGDDIFNVLVGALKDAKDEYLMGRKSGLDDELSGLRDTFQLGERFVIVLDEAQVLGAQLPEAFLSKGDPSKTRPVLRPIISALQFASQSPLIVSGTGVSIELVNEVITSAAAKHATFRLGTKTGAFDNPERQLKYILRYMPRHVAESESGKAFLVRAWNWVRGRHRFTASLLDQLLLTSFKTPHRTLRAYVKEVSKFTLSDGLSFIEKETVDDDDLPQSILPLDFTKIREERKHIAYISDLLACWLMRKTLVSLNAEKGRLVQLGLARFLDAKGENAVVDEPLAVLAASAELGREYDFSLEGRITHHLNIARNKGLDFEEFIGFYLASAFGNGHRLCDIFDFRQDVPEWAKQGAELVSVSRGGEGVTAYKYNLRDRMGATSCVGMKCSNFEETLNWFEEPSTVLCFPDDLMGPDIVLFVRLASGLILTILFQCKWRKEAVFTRAAMLEALRSVELSKFYTHNPNLKDKKYKDTQRRILEIMQGLNPPDQNIEANAWLEEGAPVLKVIVSHPAKVQGGVPARCALLNMDRCRQIADRDQTLKSIAMLYGFFKENEASEPPSKKPRPSSR